MIQYFSASSASPSKTSQSGEFAGSTDRELEILNLIVRGDNTRRHPAIELLRLAIPRRVYTQSHFDYVVDTLCNIKSRAGERRGCTFAYSPDWLRHFTARFEPL